MDQEEESFLIASDEEATAVQYLLVEPQKHHASVDGVFCFHNENLEKCNGINNFSAKPEGEPVSNVTGERGVKVKVHDERSPGVQGGHLQPADSFLIKCEDYLADIGFAEGLSDFTYDSHQKHSSSEHQISGFKSVDNGAVVVSDSSTTISSPRWESNSFDKNMGESNKKKNSRYQIETSTECEFFRCPTSSETQNLEKLKDVSDCMVRSVSSDKIEDDNTFSSGITSGGSSYSTKVAQNDEGRIVGQNVGVERLDVHENGPSFQSNNVCSHFTQKRSRKPTLRYIAESSDPNSNSKKRQKVSTRPLTTKSSGVGRVNFIKSTTPVFSSDEPFSKAIQVPFDSEVQVPVDPQVQKGSQKRHALIDNEKIRNTDIETSPNKPRNNLYHDKGTSPNKGKHNLYHDMETSPNKGKHNLYHDMETSLTKSKHNIHHDMEISLNKSKHNLHHGMETSPNDMKHNFHTTVISNKVGCSRKHQLWTLAEVRKLIDGVSQYGVGKWTEIKRLLFSSSVHRTPVDLKDKWRNLIKASCAEDQRKKEIQDKNRRNQPWRPLPKSVLRRVSELAMIYPCTRDGKSKLSNSYHVSTPSCWQKQNNGQPTSF